MDRIVLRPDELLDVLCRSVQNTFQHVIGLDDLLHRRSATDFRFIVT
jgi:hypothetical protein